MNYLIIETKKIALREDGYLLDNKLWNKTVAEALAKNQGIELTPEHWQVLEFLRNYYNKYDLIPPLRIFIKNLKNAHGPELGNSMKLHQLFPQSPLKLACMIAGLPRPKHCM